MNNPAKFSHILTVDAQCVIIINKVQNATKEVAKDYAHCKVKKEKFEKHTSRDALFCLFLWQKVRYKREQLVSTAHEQPCLTGEVFSKLICDRGL